ncbi:lysophospholipid acyltransferase family protein [Gluconacetobacter sacchari]|uniref:lysophospholipid acyltransferase family protein n=1 Tax=Gluconacetobacter sacchari TaxID=92759 RepID=UPI0039B57012
MIRALRRQFDAVRLSGGIPMEACAGRPVIVCANHPSWWDPAMFFLLGSLFPAYRQGFGPMDAAALARYPLLERAGLFGVDARDPRSVGHFLRTGRTILADPRSMLWTAAQGRFSDVRQRPLALRPGVAHLACRTQNAVVLPLALEYVFWNESRPEALARFGEPVFVRASERPKEFTARIEATLTDTLDELAREAESRDPARFSMLLRGTAGVGGLYDLGRRLHALIRGERFERRHMMEPRRP